MELFMCHKSAINGYFVKYINGSIIFTTDNSIRKLLKLNLQQYKKLFKKFSVEGKGANYFINKEDCQRICDYLNEVYSPIIKLTE
jgi:predicted oxidoreductase (fatty acid repression mutant protein)